MQIKTIKSERDECAENVIKQLEEALDIARERPQEHVAVVMLGRDGKVHGNFCTFQRFELVGALAHLQAQAIGAL